MASAVHPRALHSQSHHTGVLALVRLGDASAEFNRYGWSFSFKVISSLLEKAELRPRSGQNPVKVRYTQRSDCLRHEFPTDTRRCCTDL